MTTQVVMRGGSNAVEVGGRVGVCGWLVRMCMLTMRPVRAKPSAKVRSCNDITTCNRHARASRPNVAFLISIAW